MPSVVVASSGNSANKIYDSVPFDTTVTGVHRPVISEEKRHFQNTFVNSLNSNYQLNGYDYARPPQDPIRNNPALQHISLSNPNSVRTSPVPMMNNSMFSPPLTRRGMPPTGLSPGNRRSYPNSFSPMPESSALSAPYPIPSSSGYGSTQHNYFSTATSAGGGSTGAYGAVPGHHGAYGATPSSYPAHTQASYWTGTGQQPLDPYNPVPGPSSYPSPSYMMTQRAASLGPGGQRNSPMMGRRGETRRPLMRQHRSLESEFPPADPYFHPMGSGIGIEIPNTANTSYSTHHLSPATTQTYGGGLTYGGSTTVPTSHPLSVATGTGSYGLSGPLSTPGANFGGGTHFGGASAANYAASLPGGTGYGGGILNSQAGGGSGHYGAAAAAPSVMMPTHFGRDPYSMPVPVLQREYDLLRREYEASIQKLNTTMNSIKTFWSPELKKERGMRKEESSKLSLTQEQMKMASQENQKQAAVIRQLQDELQCQYELHRTIRDTDVQTVPKDEYEALRHERDRLHRELQLARDTVRELELQIETQRQTLVARDESIKRLLDMLQNKGILPYNAAQDRMELEHARSRTTEAETRVRYFEQTLLQKDQDIRSLQEECMNASEKMRQQQSHMETLQRLSGTERDTSTFQSLLDNKDQNIQRLERQISIYSEEINKLRHERLTGPREFTDKTISDHEYQELKLKMEKSELELSHKQSEFMTLQTKLGSSEEQMRDIKKHLEVVKEANSAKEQQMGLLQSDIEALRTKLENKNETIEQKQSQITKLSSEKSRLQSETADSGEQLKIKDGKLSMTQRKIDGLEELVKEKEQQLLLVKERLQNSPAMQQQRQIQDQLDEVIRDRDRMGREMREQCEMLENERLDILENHRREVRDLRMAIESLQKDISDRQVLIESQNENISDLNREVQGLRITTRSLGEKGESGQGFEVNRLTSDLDQARNEVERLLKIVQGVEKEKETANAKLRESQKQLEESRRQGSVLSSSVGGSDYALDTRGKVGGVGRDQRIEELEEALRESVSITAERELAVAQQKQIAQQLEQRMNHYKDQLTTVQRQFDELNSKVGVLSSDKQDKDSLIRSLKHERRRHLEEVLSLKQESLVAAISEKDAHIALLESSHKQSPDELHTLRRHKEKLMRKLKEENEKRMRLLNEQKDHEFDFVAHSSLSKDLKSSPADQLEQAIRGVELQKKKLRVFIDQLIASILDVDANLLNGLPRTQQSQGVDVKLLKKLSQNQLLLELQQREADLLQLQHYANKLLQRLAHVQPGTVRRALRLLDSLDTPSLYRHHLHHHRQHLHQNLQPLLNTLKPNNMERDQHSYHDLKSAVRDHHVARLDIPRRSARKEWFLKRHRSAEDQPVPLLSFATIPEDHVLEEEAPRTSYGGHDKCYARGSAGPEYARPHHQSSGYPSSGKKLRRVLPDLSQAFFGESPREIEDVYWRSGRRTPIVDRLDPEYTSDAEQQLKERMTDDTRMRRRDDPEPQYQTPMAHPASYPRLDTLHLPQHQKQVVGAQRRHRDYRDMGPRDERSERRNRTTRDIDPAHQKRIRRDEGGQDIPHQAPEAQHRQQPGEHHRPRHERSHNEPSRSDLAYVDERDALYGRGQETNARRADVQVGNGDPTQSQHNDEQLVRARERFYLDQNMERVRIRNLDNGHNDQAKDRPTTSRAARGQDAKEMQEQNPYAVPQISSDKRQHGSRRQGQQDKHL